ncbi:antitoxin of toxin-antitoxin stability system [Hyphomonas sp.]|uniref:antitoxin of toxin-antitoxin stability system n=1 Tax=Hyphomonas sp. TaxID=87 RepID=UPI00356A986A
MPQIVETTVYRLDELSTEAKEKARAWYRESTPDDDWSEFVARDFEAICAILGVRLKTRPVRLYGGGTRQQSCIWYRGFWSQGDGACFEGAYSYVKDTARHIRDHAPQDAELHRIAGALQSIQRRNFYQLQAEIRHRGYYYHEHCMAISVERDSQTYRHMTADAEDEIVEALRDLARWLYSQLEREYEHQTSDIVIDEMMLANDYSFTAAGRRFG